MEYSNDQVMLALSFLSYLGFYETTLGVQASERTLNSINKGLRESPCIGGEWEIAWGPAMYRMPLTVFDENLMFVVRSKRDPSRYVVVIRGTNPLSLTNWVLQDFNVILQTDWPYNRDTAGLRPKLSKGTARGLQALQELVPRRGMPGTGLTLAGFLTKEIARDPSQKLSITVTGHSLGGALAPTLALWLTDTQKTSDDPDSPPWDPNGQATIEVCSFAGPSPGNADFARYYDQKLGKASRRLWNRYDVVTHGWIKDALEGLPKLYDPDISPTLLMSLVLWSAHTLAKNGNYQHILAESAALDGAKLSPHLKDYAAQMIYQHTAAYPELFRLMHEIDTTRHFTFSDTMHSTIHSTRTAELESTAKERAESRQRTPVAHAMGELKGPSRTLSQRVSAVSKALHFAYRIPATLAMTLIPESAVLQKLKRRGARFHGHLHSHHATAA